jgi:CPA2 family monovalent cation:H+ antiporter-2
MPHHTPLIATIAAAFVLALAFGFVAARLRAPPLVGYLLAGIALGPFTPGLVANADLAAQLADVGVILLMFGVGLHFSPADLLKMRRVALPGAIAQMTIATAIGAGLAIAWGWSTGAAVVFGLALSVASTVVLLQALERRNVLDSPEGHVAMGWLIVEDLAMVLVLVMLPVIATGGTVNISARSLAAALALVLGKIVIFGALALYAGTRVVPWLLMQVARTGSRELFTLAVLAIALGIAYGSAAAFDVSFALGAFFAGVVLSESELSQRAAADSLPLKDAFAVLFFVSVGMLFDPSMLLRTPLELLAVVAVILIGKALVAYAIMRAFDFRPQIALTVSASLAQIGEFSFILASLGTSLGLLPTQGRDLILASAILSIALNPIAFACIGPLSRWLERRPSYTSRTGAEDASAAHVPGAPRESPRDHAVIVGYGRVGGVIGSILEGAGVPFTVVESDARLIEALHARKVPALRGDAMAEGVLDAAGLRDARLLVLAIPDGFQARRVLEIARGLNPHIRTAVRTHSDSELLQLQNAGVGLVVLGERELALAMADYALACFGLPASRRATSEPSVAERSSQRPEE